VHSASSIRLDAKEPRKAQPVSLVWDAPTPTNSQSVGLRNTKGLHYCGHCDTCEERLNFFVVRSLVQPVWFVFGIPGFQGGILSPLSF